MNFPTYSVKNDDSVMENIEEIVNEFNDFVVDLAKIICHPTDGNDHFEIFFDTICL